MSHLRFGIVGTGMIAGVIANAISKSTNATMTAVSNRRNEKRISFAANSPWVAAFHGIDALLTRADVDAVHIATPTAAKEEISQAGPLRTE